MATKKTAQKLSVDANGALTTKQRVAGTDIVIYPPTKGKPYHQITYYIDGVRHTTSGGKTAEEAVVKARRINARVGAGASKSTSSVNDLWAAWIDPRRPRTRPWGLKHSEAMKWMGTRHIAPTIGRIACQDLRKDDLQKCVDHAPTSGEGRRVRTALRTCLKWGYEEGYLIVPPDKLLGGVHWVGSGCDDQPVQVKVTEQGTDPLWVPPEAIPTHDAVAELAYQMTKLHLGNSSWGLPVLLSAYSGIRQGEMFALRANDVDTAKRQIRIERQKVEAGGLREITDPKGRKRRTTIYPKRTPKSARYPKGFELAKAIAAQKSWVIKKYGKDALLFPTPTGKMWNASNFRERRFNPAAQAAKWPTRKVRRWIPSSPTPMELDGFVWTWHSLRHVFCTYYLWELGAKPVDVSQAAGHSTVEITLKVYANEAPGALARLGSLA
ncbi:MAG: tyrosine-type recombinase/integrase [Actinobacteria bacterium]|nr:tyrosine-type recombinase/integrase [Actinomycetota bacterium]